MGALNALARVFEKGDNFLQNGILHFVFRFGLKPFVRNHVDK